MVVAGALETRQMNTNALEMQRACRWRKEEALKDLNLEKTKERLVLATYYHNIYHSDTCWKGTNKVVRTN